MDREENAGLAGGIEVLEFEDSSAVGRSNAVANGRPISEPRQLRILELRYGIVRAQALTPRESSAFIEQLRSSSEGDSCVEVATTSGTIHVHDSKHLHIGPRLALTPEAWADFVTYAAMS